MVPSREIKMRKPIRRFQDSAFLHTNDSIAQEEPMEIRIEGRPVAVVMRTPGDDINLVRGFLYTEGVIEDTRGLN